jgi:adenine-specific DNA-methyltransferase
VFCDLWIELATGERRRMNADEAESFDLLPSSARIFRHKLAESSGVSSTTRPFSFQGRIFEPKGGKHWSTTIDGMNRLGWANRWLVIGNSLRYVNFLDDFGVTPLTTNWTDTVVSTEMTSSDMISSTVFFSSDRPRRIARIRL